MVHTDTTPYALTRTDVTALRKADSVTFHYNALANVLDNGDRRSFVRAHKQVTLAERERDPFSSDRFHEIDLGPAGEQHRVQNYGDGDGPWTAFEMIHSAQVTETWRTAARSLKAGETIAMVWTRDNNSELTRAAGLHVDSLTIAVGVRGKPARHYHVHTSITLDNSARMIRPA
jgi:hypothetical protein